MSKQLRRSKRKDIFDNLGTLNTCLNCSNLDNENSYCKYLKHKVIKEARRICKWHNVLNVYQITKEVKIIEKGEKENDTQRSDNK